MDLVSCVIYIVTLPATAFSTFLPSTSFWTNLSTPPPSLCLKFLKERCFATMTLTKITLLIYQSHYLSCWRSYEYQKKMMFAIHCVFCPWRTIDTSIWTPISLYKWFHYLAVRWSLHAFGVHKPVSITTKTWCLIPLPLQSCYTDANMVCNVDVGSLFETTLTRDSPFNFWPFLLMASSITIYQIRNFMHALPIILP